MDLNADLGESFGAWSMGDDAAMLDTVTSANVACGFHAGDPIGILETLKAAASRSVRVGAHPGYRDLAGFGRRNMSVPAPELTADIAYQIAALQGLAAAAGTTVQYVKPHGALYNTMVHDESVANAVLDAIELIDPTLAVMGLAGSVGLSVAHHRGFATIAEAFVDRAYLPDGSLVPRSLAGAMLHDADEAAQRMLRLASTGTITAIDGTVIEVSADSLCVHGDSPDAVRMAIAVREALNSSGITIAAGTP